MTNYSYLLCQKLILFFDSQAANKALNSSVINCKTVYDSRRSLNEMANRYDVSITWVPGHRDIPGNCRTDDFARRFTTIEPFV